MNQDAPSPEAEGPAPIPAEAVPAVQGSDLVLRREEKGAFLFNPETSDLSCLNDVGVLVWEAIDGARTVEDLVRHVETHFDDAGDHDVLADVRAFLQDLVRLGYVRLD